MKTDAISIVEAAYDCEGSERTWLRRLLEQAAPKLDRGFGVNVSRYAPNMRPGGIAIDAPWTDQRILAALMATANAYPDSFHRLFASRASHFTATQALGLNIEQAKTWPPYAEHMHRLGMRDIVGLVARDLSGHAICLAAPMPDLRRPTRREVATWSRIAAHISAGDRLRRGLAKVPHGDLMQGADAVLSPAGSITHAEVGARSPSARESLRLAAKAIDRAKSKARSNEDEALDLWQGLIVGRWSLVEQFDSDGRRFMVAHRNDPQVKDPRALDLRERQVLAYVALGHPGKLIAYSLGVSPSSVSTARRTAMRKLGLQTTADVVRLFAEAPHGPSQEVVKA